MPRPWETWTMTETWTSSLTTPHMRAPRSSPGRTTALPTVPRRSKAIDDSKPQACEEAKTGKKNGNFVAKGR